MVRIIGSMYQQSSDTALLLQQLTLAVKETCQGETLSLEIQAEAVPGFDCLLFSFCCPSADGSARSMTMP